MKTRFLSIVITAIALVYLKYGVLPPKRLAPVEIAQRRSCAVLESIAMDVNTYMREHAGSQPTSFVCLAEINDKYNNTNYFNDYRLPEKRETAILVFEKPGLWKDKSAAISLKGAYGSCRVDECTFYGILDGSINWQELEKRNKERRGTGVFSALQADKAPK